jgi:2-polyprenyl-6-methoxyphenol hydroxylase-like FAD-dependent oxidoreductase
MSSRRPPPTAPRHETAAPVRRILIIGAGYGGLGLANRLLPSSHVSSSSSTSHWKVDVVDQLSPPRVGSLCGRICLPQARSLLTGLGIQTDTGAMSPQGEDSPYLDEDALLQVLRRNVKVDYLHCVTNISVAVGDRRRLYATVWKRRPGERLAVPAENDIDSTVVVQWGPYDWIVAADGVRSRWRRQLRRRPCRRLLWIGDARWVPDRPWDFGRRRLRQGGQLALRDAVELGGLLLADANRDTATMDSQWDRFRPTGWRDGGGWWTAALMLIVVALIAISWQASNV